jgi:hypothetical protein
MFTSLCSKNTEYVCITLQEAKEEHLDSELHVCVTVKIAQRAVLPMKLTSIFITYTPLK